MSRVVTAFFLCSCVLFSAATAPSGQGGSRQIATSLILDTDLAGDVDDMLALRLAHQLVDRGEYSELLAVLINTRGPWTAGVADAIATHFGRPDTLIGNYQGNLHPSGGSFSSIRTNTECFPHDITHRDQVPEADEVLRRTLLTQPDYSVDYVSVGYLTNLESFLTSPANQDLFRRKVRGVWMMAGGFPSGCGENNLNYGGSAQMSSRALALLKRTGTHVTFMGGEIGQQMLTGTVLEHVEINSPTRAAFHLFNTYYHGPGAGFSVPRPSWNPIAVLTPVRPHLFSGEVTTGSVHFNPWTGCTTWEASNDLNERYLILDPIDAQTMEAEINALLAAQPAHHVPPSGSCSYP